MFSWCTCLTIPLSTVAYLYSISWDSRFNKGWDVGTKRRSALCAQKRPNPAKRTANLGQHMFEQIFFIVPVFPWETKVDFSDTTFSGFRLVHTFGYVKKSTLNFLMSNEVYRVTYCFLSAPLSVCVCSWLLLDCTAAWTPGWTTAGPPPPSHDPGSSPFRTEMRIFLLTRSRS